MEEGSMKLIIKLGLLIIFILLTACGSGLDELKRLCEKDAGLTIYKTVEAEGYYDATAKAGGRLLDSDYQFYEYCNNDPSPVYPEPGCRRLTKVSRDTGSCDEEYDKTLMRFDRKGYAEFRKDHCIAVEKIEKPTARYKYEVEREEWWVNERDETQMSVGIGRIVDIKTGEVLGQAKNYVLSPKRSTPPSFHCGSAHVTGLQKTKPFAVGLIEKTLVPRVDNRKGETK
jgi:hypothetical protein